MSGVGQEIKRLREARGWIQAKLAVEAGMAPSAVNQIENGKRSPSANSLNKLARALDVEVADLFPKGQSPLPLSDVAGPELLEKALDAARQDLQRQAQAVNRLHASGGVPQSMTGFAEDAVRRELVAAGFPDEHFESVLWPLITRLVQTEQENALLRDAARSEVRV